jgi:CRISPR-associated protein Csx17
LNSLQLPGCAPIPLAHYLKALGILRLVSGNEQHGDPMAAGCWERDTFVLHSRFDSEGLIEFFLRHYAPTPIIVPWSGNDFFAVQWSVSPDASKPAFKERPTSSRIIEAFLASKSTRLSDYREVLALIPTVFGASKITSKKDIEGGGRDKRANKTRLLQALRNAVPDKSLPWLDSATVLKADAPAFNTVLGSGGGSDGNSHFSDNFMQALWITLPDFDEQRAAPVISASGLPFDSRAALESSVFGNANRASNISKFSPVLFNSSRVGGPNSSSGFDSEASSNPWDFILMLEGACLLGGAVSKKLNSQEIGGAQFPFLVEGTPVGLASVEPREEGREFWLPLWKKPTGLGELMHVFAEGRLERFGQSATSGVDVFVALAQQGVDRGIDSFRRIALVRGRVGGDNYFTSIDQGVFRVRQSEAANLLIALAEWERKLRDLARNKQCPASILQAVRHYETNVSLLSSGNTKKAVTAILIALGQIERTLANSIRKIKEARVTPIPVLDWKWIEFAASDSSEFRLAASLASITGFPYKDNGGKNVLLHFRQHLERVTVNGSAGRHWFTWDEQARDTVWNEGNFIEVLNRIFNRRMIRAEQSGLDELPDDGIPASLGDVVAFIQGETDDKLLADLSWGLSLLNWSEKPKVAWDRKMESQAVPNALFNLMRLASLRRNERKHADLPEVPQVPAIHRHAAAGNGREASRVASRRLRASDMRPVVTEVALSGDTARRSAAALLFPLHHFDVAYLKGLVCKTTTQTV